MEPLWIDLGDGNGLVRNPAVPDEDYAARTEQMKQDNIARLWQAAHDYEYAQINGTGVGLLTLGVLQQKPKALAVQAWCQLVWDLYYTRKAGVTYEPQTAVTDFTSCGEMPFTIPELREELGV